MNFLSKAREELKSIVNKEKPFKELMEGKEMFSVFLYMFICDTEFQIDTYKYFVDELSTTKQLECISTFSRIIQKIQKENPDEEEIILKLEIFSDTLQELNQKKKRNGEKGEGDEIEDENKGEDESKNEKFKQEQIDETFGPFLRDELKELVKEILTIKEEEDKKRTNDLKSELKSEDIIKNEQYAVTDLTGRDHKSPKEEKLEQLITDLTGITNSLKEESGALKGYMEVFINECRDQVKQLHNPNKDPKEEIKPEQPPTDLTGIIDLFKKEVESVNRKMEVLYECRGEIEKLFIDEKGNNKVAEILNN